MNVNLTLITWYFHNGRNLPWRCNTDAYKVWLSEIIMQQTRVTQGLNYFKKFTQNYPSVHHLADAPLDEVLKLWQGLGYYTRARNLHATAKLVSQQYGGVFPDTYEGLRKLKGIGDYTAAAIVSIVYKTPIAVVDGNVLRVLSRLFGVFTPIDSGAGKKEFAALAQELIDKQQPDIYNQAIMDFGAMVCTPKKAQCLTCPFNAECYAYCNNCVDKLPVKAKKIKVTNRYFNYLIVRCGEFTFIQQRTGNDIWHSLYEFPLIETDSLVAPEMLMNSAEWATIFDRQPVTVTNISDVIKHKLSHQTLWCRFYTIMVDSTPKKLLQSYKKIRINEFENFSVSRLIESYIINENHKK